MINRNRKKRVLSLALAALLSVSLLAGCGKKKEEPTRGVEQESTEAAMTDNTEAEDAGQEVEVQEADPETEDVPEESAAAALSAEELEVVYLDFLKGNSKMLVKNPRIDWVAEGNEYSYDEMNRAFEEGMEEIFSKPRLADASYVFIDCGADGVPELALRQTFAFEVDEASLYSVFKYMDGQVCLVSSRYGYYRSFTSVNPYGYIVYGGSSGAAAYYQEYRFINEDGEEVFLYSETDEMGFSGPYISPFDFPGHEQPKEYPEDIFAYDDNYKMTLKYNLTEYVYEEGKDDEEYYRANFYTFVDEEGRYIAPDEELAEIYAMYGIEYCTPEEARKRVQDHEESLGVTEQIRSDEEVEWISLLSLGIGQYAQNVLGFHGLMSVVPGKWKMPEENMAEGVSAVYLEIKETGEFDLNVEYADRYAAPARAKGHLVASDAHYYSTEFYFHTDNSNFDGMPERNYQGAYTIEEYLVDSENVKMTLHCDNDYFLETISLNGVPVFEKEYSAVTYDTYRCVSNPSEEYYLNEYEAESRTVNPVQLKLLSCTENEIIDDDAWMNRVGMKWNRETYNDGTYQYRFGGVEYYGRRTMLYIYDQTGEKLLRTFDFHDFIWAEGYEGNGFVDRSIQYALIKDDILYVNLYHNTYSADCPKNAYMMAIDMSSGVVIWKSEPLVSNSDNFLILGDNIITGYGFTMEDHYLSILNRFTGEVIHYEKVKKSPDYFYYKDGVLYVRTYSYDYEFKVTE